MLFCMEVVKFHPSSEPAIDHDAMMCSNKCNIMLCVQRKIIYKEFLFAVPNSPWWGLTFLLSRRLPTVLASISLLPMWEINLAEKLQSSQSIPFRILILEAPKNTQLKLIEILWQFNAFYAVRSKWLDFGSWIWVLETPISLAKQQLDVRESGGAPIPVFVLFEGNAIFTIDLVVCPYAMI